MRIDPCKFCGNYIDIASDHAPDCKRNSKGVVSMIVQQMFPPDGLDPDNDIQGDARLFSIWVVWKGNGKYAVQKYPGIDGPQLSRAGNWSQWAPEPYRRRQYRFTYEEACEWAEKLRGTLTCNGKTYEEFLQWRSAKNKKENA